MLKQQSPGSKKGSKKQPGSNKQSAKSQLQSNSTTTTNVGGLDDSEETKSLDGDPDDSKNYEYDPNDYELSEKDDRLPAVADICAVLEDSDFDTEKLARSLWNFLANYDINWARECICAWWIHEHLIELLEKGMELLEKEPFVLDLTNETEPLVITGPMHAHGDSLINQLTIVGTPPNRKIIFLGCYFGIGVAHIEHFAFILAMKILYPDHVYMLRGYTDDEDQMHKLDLHYWMMESGIHQRDDILDDTIEILKQILGTMPVAARLPSNVLVMSGGPGPLIQAAGLSELEAMLKSAVYDKYDANLLFEATWSAMGAENGYSDGMPFFSDGMPFFFVATC